MRFVRLTIATFIGIALISVVSAQSGGIEIRVMDSDGQPLPAATVTISHPTGYVGETAQLSNKDGIVIFPVLRATGSSIGYTLGLSFPGFAAMKLTDIKVGIGRTANVPIQLQQEIQETVTVLAQSDVVDLSSTQQTTKFTDGFIQGLPVAGRFYQNVLTLAPGVQDADGDGNPNVHGSRDRDFKAEVSGMSNVDPLTGQQMSQVNPNSIEEMEVITAGAGVEFSRAQGGFARILQKQGSNEFEGVFDMYYSSSLLDGTGADDTNNTTDPEFESLQPGFQISGPIIKDKLWYRLSHQWIKNENPINTTVGIEIVEDTWGIHADQITWQVSPRNRLALQIQSDPRTINNFGVSSTRPAESAQLREFGTHTYSLIWSAPYSPRILVRTQIGYQEGNLSISPTSANAVNSCVTAPGLEFLETAECFNSQTGERSGSYFENSADARKRFTVRGDSTIYAGRFAGATHELKFGMSVENENYRRELTRRPRISYTVVSSQDPTRPQDEPIPVILIDGTFAAPEFTTINAKGINWSLYAADQFKPAQNLTVTAGLRLDREEINSNGHEPFDPESEFAQFQSLQDQGLTSQAIFSQFNPFTAYEDVRGFFHTLASQLDLPLSDIFPGSVSAATLNAAFAPISRHSQNINVVNTNLAPRLSIAWDPWSDGKTKLFATAGRYYDKIVLAVPLIELEPETTRLQFESFRNPDTGKRTVVLSESVKAAVNTRVVDRDLRTPYKDELSIGFERAIAAETSLRVTYHSNKYRDQLQDIDLNHVPGDFGRCDPRARNNLDDSNGPDGIVDDCIGDVEIDRSQAESPPDGSPPREDSVSLFQVPDGIPDLYSQNPGWGNIFLVGNLNSVDYQALTLELIRRHYRSWEMVASYRWSKAFGDGEDFDQANGDDRSLVEDEKGFQSNDVRHSVKVAATTITPWGFRLGANLTWTSGLPYSIVTRKTSLDAGAPILGSQAPQGVRNTRTTYDSGRRNDQRNDSSWNLDLKLTKELIVGRKLNVQLSAEIFNALNDDTYTIFDRLTQVGEQVNGVNNGTRNFGRRWQLGLRFAF